MNTTRESVCETKKCRICLKIDLSDGVIIETTGTWIELYEFCFSIIINPEDLFRKLCKECAQKLSDFAEFKKLANQSEKLWQCLFQKFSFNCIEDVPVEEVTNIKEEKVEDNIIISSICDDNDYFIDEVTESLESKQEEIFVSSQNKCDEIKTENFENSRIKNIVLIRNENNPYDKIIARNVCENCKKSFRNKMLLKKHKKVNECKPKDNDGTFFYCGLCDTTVSDQKKLKQHVTEHSLNNDLNCKLCDYNGRDFADMTMHRYTHVPKGCSSKFTCHVDSCNRKFNVELALQYHYRVVHLKIKKGGWCSECDKQFINYKSWRNHEKQHRNGNYICDTCGLKFLFRHQIVSHMEAHSDYKPYICDVCGRGFKRHSNLKVHLITRHDYRKVKCKHCNKTYKNQHTLEYHMRRIAIIGRYKCEVCSKSFVKPVELKSHMIWHTDERPFVCNVCGASYKVNNQLKIHMRKHSGDRPYKCKLCESCFTTPGQLKVHVTVHTGQRRHKCPCCPRSFHWKKLLTDHCVKYHNGLTELPIKAT